MSFYPHIDGTRPPSIKAHSSGQFINIEGVETHTPPLIDRVIFCPKTPVPARTWHRANRIVILMKRRRRRQRVIKARQSFVFFLVMLASIIMLVIAVAAVLEWVLLT